MSDETELPPGQQAAEFWPVVEGVRPRVKNDNWTLTIDGEVDLPLEIDWTRLLDCPSVELSSDLHCASSWTVCNNRWTGVRLQTVLEVARPRAGAEHLLIRGYDGFTTNLPLEVACDPQVLLAHARGGKPIPGAHGGPVRLIVPERYAWKSLKWVQRISVDLEERLGTRESQGYSNGADVWADDRFA